MIDAWKNASLLLNLSKINTTTKDIVEAKEAYNKDIDSLKMSGKFRPLYAIMKVASCNRPANASWMVLGRIFLQKIYMILIWVSLRD